LKSTHLIVVILLGLLAPRRVHANGRMPGANDVLFDVRQADHLVVRATFGLVQSFAAGGDWHWICEQAIDVSGVIADPPLGMTEDGTLVLLPPTGSALTSLDGGCTWLRAEGLWKDKQGVDLTAHPSDAKQLFALLSTLTGVDAGFGAFDNRVLLTRDNARAWEVVATLPDDVEAETIEVAKSDVRRIYVSGTDSRNPRLGVLLVSEDGGTSFTKRTLDLPAGSGSFLISAIHPTNPDMLWLRVPARGDTLGILPARLYLSTDKGQNFRMLAATQRAMFGFALSPDGSQLAYGGPSDGLYVGPADGSGSFEKRGKWGVRCLRWSEQGALYACGSEPADPFSLGVSDDQGATFRPLYKLVDTCPAECAEDSPFAHTCQAAWTPVRPLIKASGAMCSVPWAGAPVDAAVSEAADDAGETEATASDAGAEQEEDALAAAPSDESAADGSTDQAPRAARDGCSCRLASRESSGRRPYAALLGLAMLGLSLRTRRRWSRAYCRPLVKKSHSAG
jgi:MYXO-CTERM domain-containing protein